MGGSRTVLGWRDRMGSRHDTFRISRSILYCLLESMNHIHKLESVRQSLACDTVPYVLRIRYKDVRPVVSLPEYTCFQFFFLYLVYIKRQFKPPPANVSYIM